jgi:DNA-binding beta-propeller fold protein YncE
MQGAILYKANITGGSSVTLTINLSASAAYIDLVCREFSGIVPVFDKQVANESPGASTISSTPIVSTTPNELFFVQSNVSGTTIGPYGVFQEWPLYNSQNPISTNDGDLTEYWVAPTIGTSVTAVNNTATPGLAWMIVTSFASGCTSPAGVTGQINYLTPNLKYCDGTNWQPVNHTVGAVCTAAQAGTFSYASSIYSFCNGSNWVSMQGNSAGTCTAASTGVLTYDSSISAPKFCNGTNWYSSAVLTSGISWFAGTYNDVVDGTGAAAGFNNPLGIARDASGNLYVGDNDSLVIRKITSGGVVTTLAGSGITDGVDGTGTAASFRSIYGIVVDSTSTNLYVLDWQDSTVRKVVIATGVVTTFAGSHYTSAHVDGTGTGAAFMFPTGIAIDSSNNLYIADPGDCTIRKITPAQVVTTISGNQTCGSILNGPVASATFDNPYGIAVNAAGTKIWVSESKKYVIRLITGGSVSTVAGTAGSQALTNGTGAAARFLGPMLIAVDSTAANLYIADSDGNWTSSAIRKMNTTTNAVSILAGTTSGYVNATGTSASFAMPTGVVVDGSSNVYVTDSGNNAIRMVTSGGVVTTLAGGVLDVTTDDGLGAAGHFQRPQGMAFDSGGNLVVADSMNSRIKKVTSAGYISTFAGWNTGGHNDDVGTSAGFNQPLDVAIDSSDNIYVLDTWNMNIRKIDSSGNVTTLAGGNGPPGTTNGGYVNATGTYAAFYNPYGIAISPDGTTLYVADYSNNVIRKVVISTGVVTTLAGQGPPASGGFTNAGTGAASQFNSPAGIVVDPTNTYIYVSDDGNSAIRRITISNGATSTLAGGTTVGYLDGTGSTAQFNAPTRMTIDPLTGNLYVLDAGNYVIRKVTPGGVVTTVIGTYNTPAYYTGAAPGKILVSGYDNSSDVGLAVRGGYLYFGEVNAIMRVPLP